MYAAARKQFGRDMSKWLKNGEKIVFLAVENKYDSLHYGQATGPDAIGRMCAEWAMIVINLKSQPKVPVPGADFTNLGPSEEQYRCKSCLCLLLMLLQECQKPTSDFVAKNLEGKEVKAWDNLRNRDTYREATEEGVSAQLAEDMPASGAAAETSSGDAEKASYCAGASVKEGTSGVSMKKGVAKKVAKGKRGKKRGIPAQSEPSIPKKRNTGTPLATSPTTEDLSCERPEAAATSLPQEAATPPPTPAQKKGTEKLSGVSMSIKNKPPAGVLGQLSGLKKAQAEMAGALEEQRAKTTAIEAELKATYGGGKKGGD